MQFSSRERTILAKAAEAVIPRGRFFPSGATRAAERNAGRLA